MITSGDQSSHVPVIVLNWNGIDDTIECISSALNLDYPDFKIYLLDNGSDNQEGIRLRDTYQAEERVEVRLLRENLGFTHAHILMVKELQQLPIRYIALLNNDTVVDRNWLSELVRVGNGEDAGVVSSKLVYYYNRNKLDNIGHQMLTTGEIVPIGYAAEQKKYADVQINFGSCAGATLYSVSMIKQIGFFDPYFSTGYEDAEFGARALVTGFKCVLAPGAIAYHKVSRSVSKVSDESYELMIRDATWYTFLKLMPMGVLIIAAPVILIKTILLVLLNLVTGRAQENRLMLASLRATFTLHRNAIKQSRRRFQEDHDLLSPFQILARQTFFLRFDLKRVWQIWFARSAKLG